MYKLEQEQYVPIGLEEAWDFFSSPKNLSTITPDHMGFIIQSDIPEKMYAGLMIKYKVKPLLNIPTTWVTEITHVREPYFFVDEQRVGPYSIWHHQHHFEAVKGGVKMRDIVHYKIPFGPLGKIAHPIIVKPQLNKIFGYREKKLVELFGPFNP